MDSTQWGALSRRSVLQAGAAAALTPYGLLDDLGLRRDRPPGFPQAIPLTRRAFENWAGSIRVGGLWTCRPRTANEAVDVVNWAQRAGWTVRPRGSMHGWSPLTVTADSDRRTRTVLVDTSALAGLELVSRTPAAVRCGAGTKLLALLGFLQGHGLGLTSVPATGEPTVAGALAIGAHGAALPGAGEAPAPGHSFGSMSNLVLEFTAIIWDAAAGRYVLRTFSRSEPDAAAFLVHLGRAFLTDVTLRAGANTNLRCESFVDIPTAELFGPPGTAGRTFESFLDASGRVEAIWFPFTDKPWLKVWSVSPTKPAAARAVTGPYNYAFSDSIPRPVARLADLLVRGADASTPQFGQLEYEVTRAGLAASKANDLWGASKDVQLYIRASTLRVDELGYGVLTRRADVQRTLALVTTKYSELVEVYRARGSYPMNGPVELRCSGVDRPADTGLPGARAPAIAASTPRPDRSEWDTVVWINLLTFPGTRDSLKFYREFERWLHSSFDGTRATLRPEWSKAWAFTETARCADREMLDETLPSLVSAGRGPDEDWAWARERLDAYDPHRVISNGFLDRWA